MESEVRKPNKKQKDAKADLPLGVTHVDKMMFSRLLYTNPVCLLTTNNGTKKNVMTISWLTPINNKGTFVCSMNKNRHTASIIQSCKQFVLNIPTKGMESLVLSIGGCTGSNVDKFSHLSIPICNPGWLPINESDETIGIELCCCHMLCSIISVQDADKDHNLLTCQINDAYIKKDYWNGKNFIPQNETVPPYFTFLGSQQFAYVKSE